MVTDFQCLQVETRNDCNLKCVYCWPQNAGIDKGIMNLEDFEYIMQMAENHPQLAVVLPFLNGDPILETRLHEICRIIKRHTNAKVAVYTNGTVFQNRELLRDLNLDDVHFTISAATAETYTRIHGKPLFTEAIRTLEWLRDNKYSNQHVTVHFVIVKDNYGEIESWHRVFREYSRILSPPAFTRNNKYCREACRGLPSIEELHRISTLHGEMYGMPCIVYNNLTINWKGYYIQCCAFIDERDFNYGHIREKTLNQAWSERQANLFRNPYCEDCGLKAKNWRELLT